MMLLSLTGIIWVQIVWIRNALSIRNENFNRAVFASLDNAANAIESNREIISFLMTLWVSVRLPVIFPAT